MNQNAMAKVSALVSNANTTNTKVIPLTILVPTNAIEKLLASVFRATNEAAAPVVLTPVEKTILSFMGKNGGSAVASEFYKSLKLSKYTFHHNICSLRRKGLVRMEGDRRTGVWHKVGH